MPMEPQQIVQVARSYRLDRTTISCEPGEAHTVLVTLSYKPEGAKPIETSFHLAPEEADFHYIQEKMLAGVLHLAKELFEKLNPGLRSGFAGYQLAAPKKEPKHKVSAV